jgi:DHA2 family multidrug resistance protein
MSPIEDSRRGLITLGLMAAAFMSLLDTTVVNVAMPHMQGSLSASPEQITWVVTSYIVASAVATPVSGWLAARLGVKPMMLLTVTGFTVTSMLCGVAANMPQMVVFRMLQGVTAAPLNPLCQAILFNINPPRRYGQAMAIFMMGTVAAPVIGPIVGGYLTEAVTWRWCFYINAPAGAASLTLLWRYLPHEAPRPRPFDFLGFGSLALAVASFQLMLDRGPSLDWFSSREICIEAILALAGLWVFTAHTLTARHPLFDPALARDRNLVSTTFFYFFFYMVLLTGLILMPLMMQGLMGYPVMLSGLMSVPRGLAMIVVMFLMGRLDMLVDRRLLVVTGVFVTLAGIWQMTRFDLSMTTREIMVAMLLQGIGQGMVFVPLATLAYATLPAEMRADASSFSSLIRSIGGSMGLAVVQAMTAFNTQSMHADMAARVIPADPVLRTALPAAFSPETAQGALALNAEITRQATMVAYVDDFRLMAVVGLFCTPLVLMLRTPKPGAPTPVPMESHG